jgi:hypothetical protein
VSTRRICAWCGRFESETTGAQSEITHSMCTTCVHEKKYESAPALKTRGQTAAQAVLRHETPETSGLESDTAHLANRRVT